MYYLGIDVSKASHQCIVLDALGEALGKSFTVHSSKDDFTKLVKKLSELNIPKTDITAGLEATGNLWENIYIFLKDRGFKVILLNPFQTNKFHQAMMKKAKTDSIDALVIAGLLRSGCAASSYIPDEDIQSLRDLTRLKDGYLKDMKTYKRKAYSLLNLVFPEFLNLVKDPFNISCTEILSKYQTASDFKNVRPKDLLKVARGHQGNNYDEAWADKVISSAKDSIYSGKASKARSIVLKSLVLNIKNLKEQIDALDNEIQNILKPDDGLSNDKIDNLLTIPGVGPKTVAVFLAEVGDIQRFMSCKDFIGFVGLYPKIEQSGSSLDKARLTTKGSRILKHALYMASVASLIHNPYLKNVYKNKLSQGKSAKQALIVVSRKLACIMYSMLKNNVVYNPERVAIAV
ncbi:MAG: IS110 family transposase [Candidatus Omnitrophica bacterium]|nr:IS110 family transposase [Candidatus Omnitrophota bacterium]